MGSGVAQVAATAGLEVVLRSRTAATADDTVAAVRARLDKLVARDKMSAADRDAAVARITPTEALADLAECDLVLESVVEDLAVKRALFGELDRACKPSTILATNTSTLPVIELAAATERPDRVVGVHFFNPAHAMSLVEIVRPLTADDGVISEATAFAVACGKAPVEVRDEAGFVVNALLFPYLNSAVAMWERGTATMEDIDAAMCGGANFPMGPFALLDLVGLDTSVAILDALHAEFGRPGDLAAPTLRRLVAAGRLGRKTGRGFYSYD